MVMCDVDLWKMLLKIEGLSDDILVENILHIKYENSIITKNIISNYMKKGRLSKEERTKLIGHYILHFMDN